MEVKEIISDPAGLVNAFAECSGECRDCPAFAPVGKYPDGSPLSFCDILRGYKNLIEERLIETLMKC